MSMVTFIIQHLMIVFVAMAISIVISVILGVISYWYQYLGVIILWVADVIQTIPTLALLALLMIVFGLGNITMVVALILYSLLPIVRNTFTGLTGISPAIKDAAKGMGMSRIQQLLKVELPLSFPMIFSGIKIAMVTSLSIAVMGVLIGAGGLGYPIYRGIQTLNAGRIMTGAIPVVVMALAFDYMMSRVEQKLIKRVS